jgi:ornithine cyclodeaminase/alanine dehydrogenase-like protein (mu-crystallin family)
MSRPDSRIAGLFGSGWQAGAHLECLLLVRPDIEEVRVYSPTEENRRRFAEEWSMRTGRKVVPVSSPGEAVRGADIVTAATAAMDPCFDGHDLEAGTHVTCITSPDGTAMRRELDDAAFDRADRIVVLSREQVHHDNQIDILGPVERDRMRWDDIRELGEVLAGDATGRDGDDEVTIFANNTGMGLQFAAVCANALMLAEEAGLGNEVPTDWFLEETSP